MKETGVIHQPKCTLIKIQFLTSIKFLIALYGAETWTLQAVDQKHPESFEMWCWRRSDGLIT
jgi:hypothetical protein